VEVYWEGPVKDAHRTYEIRCPIHGFITLNDWEWGMISQPAFQRLRRIRQLAWTDYVYPGAMHTRFEHSLGVMQVATLLYDAICAKSAEILKSDLAYNKDGLGRDRQLVRFAALLHDLGHSPFSHASEELFPAHDGKPYKHEDYSVAIIRSELREAIEEHDLNANYGLHAEDIAALVEGSAKARQPIFWRDLIGGQMDADRMDYLLRDSYHTGVEYGGFDLKRILTTIRAIRSRGGHPPQLGVSRGGWHAAEGLILARYFMFTQVYFHKTRVAYDVHLRSALKELLPSGRFPLPTGASLKAYLKWDDWKVLGLLASGKGGIDGHRLTTRDHYRRVFETPEVPAKKDFEMLEKVKKKLGQLLAAEESAAKSWYKTGQPDIPVVDDHNPRDVKPLSKYSNVVRGLKANNQVFLYVTPENFDSAEKRVREVAKGNA
jgi:HD superfamily phosphohydrolase